MSAVCIHFSVCGGCLYQDIPFADYLARKRALVEQTLAQVGLGGAIVAPLVSVPPGTRRRAALNAIKRDGGVEIGFHAWRSHAIADMHECLILTPQLFALVQGLRDLFAAVLPANKEIGLQITQADNGFDLLLDGKQDFDARVIAHFARQAAKLRIVRVTARDQIVIELDKPRLRVGESEVIIPPGCFLQPTREGEAHLQAFVLEAMKGAKKIADLFCGVGTFALPLGLSHRVYAVDSEDAMLAALSDAARKTSGMKPVTVEKRDLFKHPLTATELNRFDAAVLDPPRAGAQAQCAEIARSKLKRVAYVSCNPVSFARDARLLVAAGFRLGTVTPVDQFLWSDHIELTARFDR